MSYEYNLGSYWINSKLQLDIEFIPYNLIFC